MLGEIIGLWMYTSLIFQGQPMQKPNPDLIIYFNFTNQYENSILYFRLGQKGFCERTANYSVQQDQLVQKVKATNEDNADFCSQDPDMQINRFSMTQFELKDNQLLLHLPLGEDRLTYVWTKIF